MYAAYHLRADEINDDVIQTLKNTYRHDEIVILPKNAYTEIEKYGIILRLPKNCDKVYRILKKGRALLNPWSN